MLLCPTKLLVIQLLIIVRLNQRVIGPIREVEGMIGFLLPVACWGKQMWPCSGLHSAL